MGLLKSNNEGGSKRSLSSSNNKLKQKLFNTKSSPSRNTPNNKWRIRNIFQRNQDEEDNPSFWGPRAYSSSDTPKYYDGRSNSRSTSRGSSRSSNSSGWGKGSQNNDTFQDDVLPEYYTHEELANDDIYIVKQNYGTFSILFSVVQSLIMIIMMIQCSIAPLEINPMVGPYPDALDYWGAKNSYKILNDNEYWRLLTPIMLHAGVIHLFCNISVQLDTTAFFEREWGSQIWLIIYLTSAVGSSIMSVCFMPDNISVGSSGAVMGILGGKLGECFCRACESRKTPQSRIAYEVRSEQFSAVMCSVILVMALSFVPYVDWAAHLGGLIAGFMSGVICFSTWIKTKACAIFWFVIGVGLTVTSYVFIIIYMVTQVEPMDDLNDICGYYQQFFEDYECNCQLNNN